MSVRRAAERLVAHAEEAGYGITLKVGDDEPVVLVEPPEARQREKGAMATATHGQMTLEVEEVEADDLPMIGTVAITGAMNAKTELAKNETVRVKVTTTDGVIVAEGLARVKTIAFNQKEKDGLKWTERAHKAKVAA